MGVRHEVQRLAGCAMLAVATSACVTVLPEPVPAATEIAPEPPVEAIQVEGFAYTVTRIDGASLTNTISQASGYGQASFHGITPYGSYVGHASSSASAIASSTSTTTHIRNQTSWALQALAVHHLENRRAARLVNSDSLPSIVLKGSVGATESNGALWSAPLNVVMFFGLVLPQTWGNQYAVSVRAYTPEGEFLRQYDATADARTLHHWAWWSRLDASEQRKTAGLTVATMKVLDQVMNDLANGELLSR